jgi:phosphoketolase
MVGNVSSTGIAELTECALPSVPNKSKSASRCRVLLGHLGTSPRQNPIYIHLHRPIKKRDADIIYIAGPGPGGLPPLSIVAYEFGAAFVLD